MTTQEVLMHHLTAFGNNDLEEILKDYTGQSEILTANGRLKGMEAIRGFFVDFFTAIPKGSDFEMKQLTITGPVAYIVWTSESATFKYLMGTDTFFIQDEKILFHTVAGYRIEN